MQLLIQDIQNYQWGSLWVKVKDTSPEIVLDNDTLVPLLALKLVIEVDGGYHKCAEQAQKDAIRDAYLQQLELTVLRVSNEQVLEQLNTVLARITGYMR